MTKNVAAMAASETMKNYGCYNHPEYRKMIPVQDGWWLDGHTRVAKMVPSAFRMSTECNYTRTALGQADQKCVGCKHRVDLTA